MTSARPTVSILMSVCCTALIYFSVGLPLAVLPGWVSGSLGFSTAVAGLAISIQYVATIVSRGIVGPMIDTSGPKRGILLGLACSLGSGLVLLPAAWFVASPAVALMILFASRIVLGFGESLVGTSAIAWGIARAGGSHTARIISWNGISTYGAIAAGAPVGVTLFHLGGMPAVAIALCLVGIAGLAFVWPQPATRTAQSAERLSYASVFAKILPYGMALGLGAIGFGATTAFIALFYTAREWGGAWMAITAFGAAFILARILFVSSIARHGGLKVAASFLTIEAIGLLMIWMAAGPGVTMLGAALAGFGFALLFPALGMIVVDLVPLQNRGAAIGAYSMFTDIALCVTGPVGGVLAGHGGAASPFLFAGIASLLGLAITFALMRRVATRPASAGMSPD